MTPTGKGAAIPAERNSFDRGSMLCECVFGLLGSNVPQDDRAIMTPTGKYAAIRAKRNTPGTGCMPRECSYGLFRDGIPQDDRAVLTPTGERAVPAECDTYDPVVMPRKNRHLIKSYHCPPAL